LVREKKNARAGNDNQISSNPRPQRMIPEDDRLTQALENYGRDRGYAENERQIAQKRVRIHVCEVST
jgi:hypothetical protein